MTKNHVIRISNTMKRQITSAIALIFAISLLTACDARPDEAPASAVGAGQIIENPSNYVGKTVTVTGEVEDLHGPRAFEMDSGVNLGELLVLGKDPYPQVPDGATNRAFIVDDTVTVTGVVRMMVTTEIERELGWDLEPQLEVEFDRKPVLIAKSLSFTPRRAGASPTPMAGMSAEVQDFAQFVREKGPQQAGLGHEYASTGIQRLSVALTALAKRDGISDQDIEQKRALLQNRAQAIQTDPQSLRHADKVREAFIAASDLMAAIQQKSFPNLSAQMAQARQAAEAISNKEKLLEQTAKVETFFQRANDALQAMARTTG